jgi:hypothetical protein
VESEHSYEKEVYSNNPKWDSENEETEFEEEAKPDEEIESEEELDTDDLDLDPKEKFPFNTNTLLVKQLKMRIDVLRNFIVEASCITSNYVK